MTDLQNTDESLNHDIQRECRRIFDTHTPCKVVAMMRIWYLVVLIMSRDDLQRLFPYQPNFHALPVPLLYELLEAIKANFSDPTSEYDINQFIETWRPSAFANVPDKF